MRSAVCLLLVVINVVLGDSGPRCSQHTPSRQVFSYTAHPNELGQWEAQLGFWSQGMSNKSLPISLSVDQTHYKNCEGSHILDIIVNITGGTTTITKKSPPADYEFFPSHGWYKFHTQGVPWTAARDTCATEGAHLVIPNSEVEVTDVIKKLFTKTPKSSINGHTKEAAWVGIVEDNTSGSKQYRTLSGDLLSAAGFNRWTPGQPNENNACVWIYERDFGLTDVVCSTLSPFVCEINL